MHNCEHLDNFDSLNYDVEWHLQNESIKGLAISNHKIPEINFFRIQEKVK